MSSFNAPLSITQVGYNLWRLNRELIYSVGSLKSNEEIICPKGYVADGSSVPSGFWWLVGHPLEGPNAPAGFIHDIAYGLHLYPQKRCDEIYLEALKVLGCPLWNRQLKYRALRMFGHFAYNSKDGKITIEKISETSDV